MNTRQEIYEKLVEILVEEFELEKESLTLEANLYTDLDLDSIDTVDLVINLQEMIDRKIDPEIFKSVRTVDDVITAVEDLIKE